MTPNERAFVTAVIRFQTLLNAGVANDNGELAHLERFLGADAPDAMVVSGERRRFRRFPTKISAVSRARDVSGPCTLVDIGGGGFKIENDAGLEVAPGDALVVSIESDGGAALRVDLPGRVCHVSREAGWFGLEFAGAPLIMHQRRAGQSGRAIRAADRSTAGTAEVPMARPASTARDFAA